MLLHYKLFLEVKS